MFVQYFWTESTVPIMRKSILDFSYKAGVVKNVVERAAAPRMHIGVEQKDVIWRDASLL